MMMRTDLLVKKPKRFISWSSVLGAHVTLLLLVAGGCKEATTIEVRGTVALDGIPLQAGEIEFAPAKETVGPVAGATIEQGRYRIPPVAQGLKAGGVYEVSIISMVPGKQMVADPNEPSGKRALLINTIPDRYNVHTELEVTISGQKQRNVFDFNLTSDAP
jgi:hypothetical protein